MVDHSNRIQSATIAFGNIGSSYSILKDLGVTHLYKHFSIDANVLNQDITIRFGRVDEVIWRAFDVEVLDDFKHNGLIEIKHNGAAPTAGSVQIKSWGL